MTIKGIDIASVIGIVALVAHIAALVIFPGYREFCLDLATWGWRTIVPKLSVF